MSIISAGTAPASRDIYHDGNKNYSHNRKHPKTTSVRLEYLLARLDLKNMNVLFVCCVDCKITKFTTRNTIQNTVRPVIQHNYQASNSNSISKFPRQPRHLRVQVDPFSWWTKNAILYFQCPQVKLDHFGSLPIYIPWGHRKITIKVNPLRISGKSSY